MKPKEFKHKINLFLTNHRKAPLNILASNKIFVHVVNKAGSASTTSTFIDEAGITITSTPSAFVDKAGIATTSTSSTLAFPHSSDSVLSLSH